MLEKDRQLSENDYEEGVLAETRREEIRKEHYCEDFAPDLSRLRNEGRPLNKAESIYWKHSLAIWSKSKHNSQ